MPGQQASRPTESVPPTELFARTVAIDDPGTLAGWMPQDATAAWMRRGDGMVGIGSVATFHPRDLADGEAWWTDFTTKVNFGDGPGPIAFGTFLFDPHNSRARSTLVVPELIIGRREGQGWLTLVSADPNAVPELPQRPSAPADPGQIAFADGALSGLQWEHAVARAVDLIRAAASGDSDGLDKVVLARDLIAGAEEPIDARWLISALARDYQRCWTYAIDGLVGSTPEMLIRREGGLATSRVLAGTIRRSGNDAHDLALAAALSQSSKDLEEHEYAVRSVAEQLAPFCLGMNVPDAPYVLELPNVLHLATDVTAVAHPDVTALSMAGALHPSAAICGTPTERARRVIAELEEMDRERYSGPIGWVDANGDGEWGIALRCGQLDADDRHQIRLFAGCGIVAGSDPVAELAESNAKLVPMRDALSGVMPRHLPSGQGLPETRAARRGPAPR